MPGLELHCDSTGLVQNVPQHLTQISNLPMDPFNSSTSQISFLWNVISPREKVSVPIDPLVCNIILILSLVFWIGRKLFQQIFNL